MRFIIDECTGPEVATWLRSQGHEAISIFDDFKGIDDDEVLEKALVNKAILITNDKDFGEKVFRERRVHHGVILLRLANERPGPKIEILERLLANHQSALPGNFTVATEHSVRIVTRV
jgi:predicted nuclease of predicted toxin-antitoxin system